VIAGYCNLPAGKSEAALRFTHVSGWATRLEIAGFAGAHDDHLFPRGEPVRFELRLRNHSDQPFTGRAVFEVGDHAGAAKTQTFELPVRIDGQGQTTLDWRMQPAAPLVARAAMRIQAGEEVIGSRDFVFVYDAEHYRPPLTRPADFQVGPQSARMVDLWPPVAWTGPSMCGTYRAGRNCGVSPFSTTRRFVQ
jgi:hypothetical protein